MEAVEADDSDLADCILAATWRCTKLGAVIYNLETMEMTIMRELVDLRPDFTYLANLMRQICPAYLLLNGPPCFTEGVMDLIDIPAEIDLQKLRKRRNKAPAASSILTYNTVDDRDLPAARAKVMSLRVPGMPENATETERSYFITSVFPLDQNTAIQSLGILLEYLETHFARLFVNNESSPIITNVTICHLQAQLLMDLSTFYGLQIFTSATELTTLPRKKELNLFNLLNQTISHVGANEMRNIMLQPTRDLLELNLRLSTIEWCMAAKNYDTVVKFRHCLHKIRNLNMVFRRIVTQQGMPVDFKSFKRSVYHAYLICETCAQLPAEEVAKTFLKDFADAMNESVTIKGVLFAVNKTVDIEESEREKRFVVKPNLDTDLDRKKEELNQLVESLNNPENISKMGLPPGIREFFIIFLPGMGFVIGAPPWLPNMKDNPQEGIEFIFEANDTVYFRTDYCTAMNDRHGYMFADIELHERRIFQRLIRYLTESLPELVAINKLCAKLDCMTAFASVALQRDYVRPQLTLEKVLSLRNARHPLVETLRDFTPNQTDISADRDNLVTILSAPNSAGKSIYLKEIAICAYMAHIGCFVPAEAATIGLLDSIYSRIYCPETIGTGESSFLTDLKQMSHVLMHSTDRSLVLIDEFGKGTNVQEGQALLAAALDNLIERRERAPITLVSTHYIEIFELLSLHQGVALKTIRIEQDERGMRSLYQVVDGYNEACFASDYEETNDILDAILQKNPTTVDTDIELTYEMATAAACGLALALVEIMEEDGDLNMDVVRDLFNNASLAEFMDVD